jgi:hypothetical protein
MSYPRFQRARAFKHVRHTSGNVAVSSTSWANFDTGMDITLDAQTGDVIEVGLSALADSAGTATDIMFDAGTLVSSAIVNVVSSGTTESGSSDGVGAWYCTRSAYSNAAGSVMYTLQSGDISSGTVTVRLRVRLAGAGSRNIFGSTTDPVQFSVKNLGPVDPH